MYNPLDYNTNIRHKLRKIQLVKKIPLPLRSKLSKIFLGIFGISKGRKDIGTRNVRTESYRGVYEV